jgi:hypothetical protein
MPISQTGENLFLDAITGFASLPTTLYLALSMSTPEAYNNANALSEPTGGYARQEVLQANWTQSSSGSAVYSDAIQFPTATANWGVVKTWVLCTALTGGNIIVWEEFDTPLTVTNGQMVTIPAETFGLTVSSLEDSE